MVQIATGATRPERSFMRLSADFFAPQPTSSSELPDPVPLVRNLTNGVLEALAGVRDIDQLARCAEAAAGGAAADRRAVVAQQRRLVGALPPAVHAVARLQFGGQFGQQGAHHQQVGEGLGSSRGHVGCHGCCSDPRARDSQEKGRRRDDRR